MILTALEATPTNTPPAATVEDRQVGLLEWTRLNNVPTLSDAENDTITKYELWDSEGGDNNWWIGGTGYVDATTGYETSLLGNVWFQGADAFGEQTLWVRAFDGGNWSDWGHFDLTSGSNTPPEVDIPYVAVSVNGWTRLDAVASVSDFDNDQITKYEVWDSEGGDDNWWLAGGVGYVDASNGFEVDGALSSICFQGADTAGDQTLWVHANDGTEWSAWEQFELFTV